MESFSESTALARYVKWSFGRRDGRGCAQAMILDWAATSSHKIIDDLASTNLDFVIAADSCYDDQVLCAQLSRVHHLRYGSTCPSNLSDVYQHTHFASYVSHCTVPQCILKASAVAYRPVLIMCRLNRCTIAI